MRVALATTVLVLGASAAPAISVARTAAKSPTRAQIRKAIKRAERSKSLWATVNICNSKRLPNEIGVRGQMPALGFSARLTMNFRLRYYSSTDKRFDPIPHGGTRTDALGRATSGLQQDGATWTFKRPTAVLLDATVQFVWRRDGKLLGEATRTTTAGHPDADFGSPLHYTAPQCMIP